MKKTWFTIIAIALVLLIVVGVVVYQRNKASQQEKAVSISELSSEADETKLEKILENDGIGKWGFAVSQDRVCYATEDMSIRRFILESKKDEKVFSPLLKFDAVKVAALGQNCLVEYFGRDKNLLYLIDSSGKADLLEYVPTAPIEVKLEYFVVPTAEEIVILDTQGSLVEKIANKEGNIFAIAPIAPQDYFAVFNYDEQMKVGNLGLIEGGKQKFTKDVQNAYSLFANSNAALYVYQDGISLGADLFSVQGKLLKKLVNPDPNSIFALPDGFYFVTKPGGAEDASNDGNGIGFVANSGDIKNIISSVTQTEKQYSFKSVQRIGNILYVSSGNTVYKISL